MKQDRAGDPGALSSELAELQATLAASEAQLASLKSFGFHPPALLQVFDTSHIPAVIVCNGMLEYVNHTAARIFGYDQPEDVVGTAIMSLVAPSSQSLVEKRLQPTSKTSSNPPEIVELLKQDGSRVFTQLTWIPTQADGRASHLLIGHDVTQKRLAEEVLAFEQDRARHYLDSAPVIMVGLDTDGRVTLLNRFGCNLLGVSEENARGQRWIDTFIPPDLRIRISGVLDNILGLASSEHWYEENEVLTASGERRLIAWHNSLIHDAAGMVAGTLSSGQDITESRAAEELLRRGEERLQSIFRAAPIGIGVVCDRVLLQVNDTLCKMLGYSESEMIDRGTEFLYPGLDEYERVGREKYAQMDACGTGTLETQWRRKDGELMDILLSSTVINPKNRQEGVTFTALDITERRRAREELDRFFRQSLVMLCLIDLDGHFRRVNPAFEKILGYTEDAFIKTPFMDKIHPDDHASTRAALDTLRGGGSVVSFNNRWRTNDGEYRTLEWTAAPDVSRGLIYGIASDVTERLQLEDQLRHSQKMDAIGQLAGGIAHDFNNQLAAIMGYGELLGQRLQDEVGRRFISGIVKAAKRSATLTSQLLAFSRKGKFFSTTVDLHSVISEVFEILAHTIDRRILLRRDFCTDQAFVVGDPGQLLNVLLNLCLNARDAMPDGGSIVISTEQMELDAGQVESKFSELEPGRYLRVRVADTGTGIPEKIQARVFEPFFTTKETGKGTGMGLAAVYGTIKSHGGLVFFESTSGTGTTFTLILPLSRLPANSAIEDARPITKVNGDYCVMLVDDEAIVQEMTRTMLIQLGYRVMVANDGAEAVALFEQHHTEIDVVILDFVMPVMNGRDAFRKLRECDPNVKVVVASGYSVEGDVQNMLDDGALGSLQKPFGMKELSAILQRLVG